MLHEAIKFYNPTDENFVGVYDGQPYDIPGKSVKYFAAHIAEHFAKHLANKILNDQFDSLCREHVKPSKDTLKTCKGCAARQIKLSDFYNVPERDALYKIILPKEEPKVEEPPQPTPPPAVE